MWGEKFKIVYTDWLISDGERRPFGNGIHPIIREFIQYIHKNKLNIDYYKIFQYQQKQKGIPFDHSELINYFYRNFPKNIVSLNQILDDDFTYIYPLEIKDTLQALNRANKFEHNGQEYSWYLKDILSKQLLDYLKKGKIKILVSVIHDPMYDDYNIKNFEIQMLQMGINTSNIIFLGGSNFTEYYEKNKDSRIKIYNGHIFLKGYADMMKTFPTIGSLGYLCELVTESDLDYNKIRPHKFLCNNKTMSKSHRVAIGYLAIKYDLLKNGLFSFIEKVSAPRMYDTLNKIIENPNKEYISLLASIIPYELDTQHLSTNEKTSFGATNNMKEWYSDTYINLVTETFFGKNVFLSEKIFKPLSNLQPFIVLGDYGTLAELKRLGFKTFEPFIDESYDSEIDPKIRIVKIEKEIEKLANKSIEEIHNWYYSIKDILIYNQKHLYTFAEYECFEEIFKQIKLDYENLTQWSLQEKRLL
ncbi:MAG: hypothetical protein FJ375_00870 [Pelagibacterales bacterium]|nr:hypothetical protein [Pelagibacterales bacterium]